MQDDENHSVEDEAPTPKEHTFEASKFTLERQRVKIAGARYSVPMAVISTNTVPKPGSTIRLKGGNGVTYVGTCSEAEKVDGKVCVTFERGLKPA